jgi:hypothetical protein
MKRQSASALELANELISAGGERGDESCWEVRFKMNCDEFSACNLALPACLYSVSPSVPLVWKFVPNFIPKNMVKLITKY